jgi:menaquinone-9 beta-reductase
MMHDVLIAGAGPAGCIAAIVLARAGARVRVIDRARFPRHKLCGDTLNPGALAVLRRLGLQAGDDGLPIAGMIVTGPGGVSVNAVYPRGMVGRAVLRKDLDYRLLQSAANAGADIEEGVVVRRAVFDQLRRSVGGLVVRGSDGGDVSMPSRLTIAADGRESRLARGLTLASHPRRPRRWAVGAYFSDARGLTDRGEMHIRSHRYIGVAPVPGGLTNVCVVTDDRLRLRRPSELLLDTLRQEPLLTERFAGARMVTEPVMLGPLAVDCAAPGVSGLLLAGDAAGFIDPMTGDGLRFALRGAELAAEEALSTLQRWNPRAHWRLHHKRRREFAAKWRFNRALRRLIASERAVRTAARATALTSWPLRRIIQYAGDVQSA